ncbi:MAG: hypothetical protein OXF02_05360 [Simkaniaceae bacterium]|nr:hypothetical protein [Simkaniaceae bacterium]
MASAIGERQGAVWPIDAEGGAATWLDKVGPSLRFDPLPGISWQDVKGLCPGRFPSSLDS